MRPRPRACRRQSLCVHRNFGCAVRPVVALLIRRTPPPTPTAPLAKSLRPPHSRYMPAPPTVCPIRTCPRPHRAPCTRAGIDPSNTLTPAPFPAPTSLSRSLPLLPCAPRRPCAPILPCCPPPPPRPPPSPSPLLLHAWASFDPKRRPKTPARTPSSHLVVLLASSLTSVHAWASFDPKRRPKTPARTPSPHLAFLASSLTSICSTAASAAFPARGRDLAGTRRCPPILKVHARAPPRTAVPHACSRPHTYLPSPPCDLSAARPTVRETLSSFLLDSVCVMIPLPRALHLSDAWLRSSRHPENPTRATTPM